MNLKQTAKELRWKAKQLKAEADRYDSIANQLEGLETWVTPQASPSTEPGPEPTKKKRTLSASARRRIAAAQRARWAKWKKAKKAGKVLQFGRAA